MEFKETKYRMITISFCISPEAFTCLSAKQKLEYRIYKRIQSLGASVPPNADGREHITDVKINDIGLLPEPVEL